MAICALTMAGICQGEEPTSADLVSAPMAVVIEGMTLTAVAHPYINYMPTLRFSDKPIDCQREGWFIVIVDIRTDSPADVLAHLKADRIWVFQGEATWSGPARLNEVRSRARAFRSQDCNTPIQSIPVAVSGQAEIDAVPRARTIIRFWYGGQSYLLRAPDAIVGAPS